MQGEQEAPEGGGRHRVNGAEGQGEAGVWAAMARPVGAWGRSRQRVGESWVDEQAAAIKEP
eukprot:471099-Pelagomonas_calceolata.AAC.1